jgi:hypothetical protein
MDKDYKKAFENILKGKLYYKNSNEYHQANDIIYNHPFIQDLIKKAERLEAIESADGGDAMNRLVEFKKYACDKNDSGLNQAIVAHLLDEYQELKNYILKSQQQEKELERYKNIKLDSDFGKRIDKILKDIGNMEIYQLDILLLYEIYRQLEKAKEQQARELEEKHFKEIVGLLYNDLEYLEFSIVDYKPSFVNDKTKERVDIEYHLLDSEEYVIQKTGMLGDDFSGQIARKFKDTDKWLLITYEC